VTGWVRHTSHDVISLTLDENETLNVTRHHRLFSADRGDWVRAGDVGLGELLQTKDGTVHVTDVGAATHEPAEVFNLEIFGAHRYFVGEHRVLAHNTYGVAGSLVNQLPELLAGETEAATSVGAAPISASAENLAALANEGTLKWVVTEGGELVVGPHTVEGVEISHAFLSGGGNVLGAGHAEIAAGGGRLVGLSINAASGHFGMGALEVGKAAFAAIGVTF
jgi:hypothetical protein